MLCGGVYIRVPLPDYNERSAKQKTPMMEAFQVEGSNLSGCMMSTYRSLHSEQFSREVCKQNMIVWSLMWSRELSVLTTGIAAPERDRYIYNLSTALFTDRAVGLGGSRAGRLLTYNIQPIHHYK